MAIKLPNGFKIGSVEPIDTRLVLTKAEMLAINENTMPAHYFTLCSEDNNLYVFDKTNESLPVIGKFRLYKSGGEDVAIDNKTIVKDSEGRLVTAVGGYIEVDSSGEIIHSIDGRFIPVDGESVKLNAFGELEAEISSQQLSEQLPDALKETLASQSKDSGLEVDSEGNISVKLNQEHLQIIDNKIDLAISVIQAIGDID